MLKKYLNKLIERMKTKIFWGSLIAFISSCLVMSGCELNTIENVVSMLTAFSTFIIVALSGDYDDK